MFALNCITQHNKFFSKFKAINVDFWLSFLQHQRKKCIFLIKTLHKDERKHLNKEEATQN